MNDIYTFENWLLFLKIYFPNCKNQNECYVQLSKIIGLTPNSIKASVSKKKELPTWAKAFIFSFINSQNMTKELVISECIQRIENALNPMKLSIKTDLPPTVDLEIEN